MAGALRELLALFDIRVETEELEHAHKKVEGFTETLKTAGEAIVEALGVEKFKEFFEQQIEGAAHVQDLAERLDLSAGSIKRFAFATKSAGLDFDTTANTLGLLEKNLGLAARGGAQADAFTRLGVAVKDAEGKARPLEEVILDVAEAFQKLPDQQARAAASMDIFGRQGRALVPVLSKGREALQDMFNEAKELGSGLGDQFYKDAKVAREEGEHFGMAIGAIKTRIVGAALPSIIDLLRWLKSLGKETLGFTKNTNVLKTVMLALGGVALVRVLKTVRDLGHAFGILQPTIGGTVSSLMKLAKPLLLAAALYLVFDELYTLMTGGKTIIGDIVDKLNGVGTAAELALYLNAIFQDTLSILGDVGSVLKDTVLAAVESVVDEVKGLAGALKNLATGDFGAAWESIKGGNSEASKDLNKRGQGILAAGARMVNGTDTKHLEDLDVLIKAGVDPRMIQAGALGHGTAGAAAATKEGIVAQNTNNPFAHGWYVPLPSGHGPGAGARVDMKVTQHINTKHDNPKAIGEAAGMGTASATEKAMNAALASQVAP